MKQEVIRTNCGMCHGGCGILAHVANGRLVKVEGDPDCPTNRGAMCAQGLSAVQYVYHPDRIKYPMKRVGDRGGGIWQRITWVEALDIIAARLRDIRTRYGARAVAVGKGTGRPVNIHVTSFTNALGCSPFSPLHICFGPIMAVGSIIYGRYAAADLENTRCVVNWTSNVNYTAAPQRGRLLGMALRRGAKLITVDPCMSPLAARSDIWLQLRPGTDCALALAWLHTIISDGLYDKRFVDLWTSGFSRLARHVESFTPGWAEKITWVPAHSIREAARLYATTKPAAVHTRVPLEFGTNVTNTLRSLFILPAVTGNIDIPGGNVIWDYATGEGTASKRNPEVWESDWGSPLLNRLQISLPGHGAWRAILEGHPYPIKAMLIHGSNPIMSHENPRELVHRAMIQLDFLSVMDIFMTPTAELADIVLPASTPFERDDIHNLTASPDFYFPPTVCAAPRVVEPLDEAWSDLEVFIEICKRLELDYGAKSVGEMLDRLSRWASGMDFERLKAKGYIVVPQVWRKYEKGLLRPDRSAGFNTASGKIELCCPTSKETILDDLPVHKEPPESPMSNPDLAASFPLVLTTGYRSPMFYHSQYRQLPWLRQIHREPIVRINPSTAARYGIGDGDWVYIESPRGRCRQKALLTVGIDPRVVMAEHDWWFPEKPPPEHGAWESNVNLLVDSEIRDPAMGSTPGRSLLCRICRADPSDLSPSALGLTSL